MAPEVGRDKPYVQVLRERGLSEDQIRSALLELGWQERDIDKALQRPAVAAPEDAEAPGSASASPGRGNPYVQLLRDRGQSEDEIRRTLLELGWQEREISQALEHTTAPSPASPGVAGPAVAADPALERGKTHVEWMRGKSRTDAEIRAALRQAGWHDSHIDSLLVQGPPKLGLAPRTTMPAIAGYVPHDRPVPVDFEVPRPAEWRDGGYSPVEQYPPRVRVSRGGIELLRQTFVGAWTGDLVAWPRMDTLEVLRERGKAARGVVAQVQGRTRIAYYPESDTWSLPEEVDASEAGDLAVAAALVAGAAFVGALAGGVGFGVIAAGTMRPRAYEHETLVVYDREQLVLARILLADRRRECDRRAQLIELVRRACRANHQRSASE